MSGPLLSFRPSFSRPALHFQHTQPASQLRGVNVRIHHVPAQVENVIVAEIDLFELHPVRGLDENLALGGQFLIDPLYNGPHLLRHFMPPVSL